MADPKRYRKKPVVIEAMQWSGGPEAASPIVGWVLDGGGAARWYEADPDGMGYPECIAVDTMEGVMRADLGDWIIRGVAGEFYPCKPDIFAATYGDAD